jgi:hypothetical protein
MEVLFEGDFEICSTRGKVHSVKVKVYSENMIFFVRMSVLMRSVKGQADRKGRIGSKAQVYCGKE